MQAGGVVAWGLPSLYFLASFMFELEFLERLGYIATFFIFTGILGELAQVTVISYLVVALVKYEYSMFSASWEIWVTLAVYIVI